MDDYWEFHCGRGSFHDIHRYMLAFNNHYGESKNVQEFAFKSQAASYDAIRAMYEAFAAHLPHTTGIVQWMLNASWPKLYWQLYDYDLTPGGAFFGVKKGAAPLAVIYNYGDQGVYLVNQGVDSFANYRTAITVYDLNSKKILETVVTNSSSPGTSQKIYDLSSLAPTTPVYFVDLHGEDSSVKSSAADNFYWLSVKPDVLDEEKSNWFMTPNKSYADFTSLSNLAPATVTVRVSVKHRDHARQAEVTLNNPGDTLAFFIEMKMVGAKSGQMLTPVFWDDNYISLPPHTKKVLHVRFPEGEAPELKVEGWNVKFKVR